MKEYYLKVTFSGGCVVETPEVEKERAYALAETFRKVAKKVEILKVGEREKKGKLEGDFVN